MANRADMAEQLRQALGHILIAVEDAGTTAYHVSNAGGEIPHSFFATLSAIQSIVAPLLQSEGSPADID